MTLKIQPWRLTSRKEDALFPSILSGIGRRMNGVFATILSVAVLGVFALLSGGVWLLVKRREIKQGLLMLVAAAVLLVNVLIWTMPLPK
jgi:hypothetical protein